jgi:hypothetical protein
MEGVVSVSFLVDAENSREKGIRLYDNCDTHDVVVPKG